jgi:hypothetical protein
VKQFVAIVFSLLLIVAPTFAGRVTVGSDAPPAKPDCCGGECDCHCCVAQSDAPASVPVELAWPGFSQQGFVLLPAALVVVLAQDLLVISPADFSSAQFPGSVPPFLRHRTLLL